MDLVEAQRAAEIFAGQRNYLLGVSYRLTGSWADAEDVVAEAWPRWAEHADEVLSPRAWLTRAVGRLSLDHLRSARSGERHTSAPGCPNLWSPLPRSPWAAAAEWMSAAAVRAAGVTRTIR